MVSVIIPTYNRSFFLKEAISSVLSQTYTDMELIIVDDGSEDDTRSLVFGVHSPYIPIVYAELPHTGFPGLVRNRGIQRAGGEYIAFLDSDDLWIPDKIQKQVRFFQTHEECVICHTGELWIRNGKRVSQKGQIHRKSGYIFEDALKKCIISPSSVMVKQRTLHELGLYREDIEIAEDYELWLRVTSRFPVGYLDAPYVVKRGGHPDQLSQKYGHIEVFRIQALVKVLEANRLNKEQKSLASAELARKCSIYAAGCRKRHREDEAADYLNLAKKFEISDVS